MCKVSVGTMYTMTYAMDIRSKEPLYKRKLL